MMTSVQCRAARALLDWSQLQLAEVSGANVSTIRDFETGRMSPVEANVEALQRAFEAAGIEFHAEIGGGTGVKLMKEHSSKGR